MSGADGVGVTPGGDPEAVRVTEAAADTPEEHRAAITGDSGERDSSAR